MCFVLVTLRIVRSPKVEISSSMFYFDVRVILWSSIRIVAFRSRLLHGSGCELQGVERSHSICFEQFE